MRSRLFAISLVAAVCLAPAIAGASKSGPRPLVVESSSLVQDGQQVIWKVVLTQPFSPAALAHAGRSLCLLLLRPSTVSVSGQLCVAGPRRGHRSPRIVYQRVTRAGPSVSRGVAAAVIRTGPRELTATFLPSSIGIAYRPLRWQVISTLRPPACTPRQPNRVGCLTLYPSKPPLAELHTPQLVGCVPSGAPFVYNGPSTGHMIALTFDDGPWYDTPQFLDLLEHYQVHATFFEIGDQVSEYGQGGAIERRMLADGDMIGDHTWNHQDVAGAGSFAAGEISQAAAAIRQAAHGFEPCLFRAPYGDVSGALISEARAMGFTTIQWNIDPRDWALPGTLAIYQNVVSNARPGGIVEMHDGGGNRSETLAALPQMIQRLRSRGYQFVTVTQLLGQRLIYR